MPRSPLAVVVVVTACLLVANLVVTPGFLAPDRLPGTAELFVPLALAAMASVPSILSGGGGLDLSVGPLLGIVNIVAVAILMPAGLVAAEVSIPLCVLLGAAVGAINGAVVAFVRLQPIVVTLGTYLVLDGLALVLMPQPVGTAPPWAAWLSGSWLGGFAPRSLLLLVAGCLLWVLARRLGFVTLVRAVGSDARAAFTSGVRVGLVRFGAYALGGALAGLAGLALTVLINSGDATVGPQYTLAAVAAVALGGNALSGGRGGIAGPLLGALTLFLIQSLLSALAVSSLWIQVVHGSVLLAAVCINSSIGARVGRRAAAIQGG
ncbi:hypothetical protein BJF90_13455 [Pseudonocardia sp. CNS-004]|nr:hypothetical protein BJF90_13455 [Pseudonocardia sp. CNS-004]